MTVKEIFTAISAHQVEGMMLHNDMADYYDFLGLMGFKRMHEYRFLEETKEMRSTHRYFINHYNMLLNEGRIVASSYIPYVWRDYTRNEVESGAKLNAITTSFEDWTEWEHNTKKFYEEKYKELIELGEVAAAEKVTGLIKNVDEESKKADRLHIALKSMGFDMPTVIAMQEKLHNKYEKKSAGLTIC